jgi:hypothetical protein
MVKRCQKRTANPEFYNQQKYHSGLKGETRFQMQENSSSTGLPDKNV